MNIVRRDARGRTMILWFIQKWMVPKGKVMEHEELMKKWSAYATSQNKQNWYLSEPIGPIGSRIFIIRFGGFADMEDFFVKMDENEENIKLRDKWVCCIDSSSYEGFFWRERALE